MWGYFDRGNKKNYAGLCSKELSPCGSSLRPIADRMEGWARASLRPALLARLPTPRVAPAVEACDDHNPVNLNLKEYPVGKAPHSRTATAPVNHRKLHRMIRDYLNRRFDCQREPLPKPGANVVIPCPRFQQILTRFRYPVDWQRHSFLNRLALTCSQGMTSEGFCSCRSMR